MTPGIKGRKFNVVRREASPGMNRMLIKVAPSIFPRLRSISPLLMTSRDVTSSGIVIPRATIK